MQMFDKSKLAIALVGTTVALTSTAAIVKAQDLTDWLDSGYSAYHNVTAEAGAVIEAVCDADCSDLDLVLYDYYTEEIVASDVLVDAAPYVVAPYSGDFTLEVRMVSCSIEPCAAWTYF